MSLATKDTDQWPHVSDGLAWGSLSLAPASIGYPWTVLCVSFNGKICSIFKHLQNVIYQLVYNSTPLVCRYIHFIAMWDYFNMDWGL